MPATELGQERRRSINPTELDLLARASAGDSDAFDALVVRHAPGVRRLAHRLLGWRGHSSELDDVVQEVFVRLLENIRSFRGEAALATWLARITVNRCRSLQRRRWLQGRWIRLCGRAQMTTNATAEIADRDTVDCVRAAVRSLKPKDRELIVLRYLEERPAAEIAQMLGLSSNALDVRLHRARQRLKALLGGLLDDA